MIKLKKFSNINVYKFRNNLGKKQRNKLCNLQKYLYKFMNGPQMLRKDI